MTKKILRDMFFEIFLLQGGAWLALWLTLILLGKTSPPSSNRECRRFCPYHREASALPSLEEGWACSALHCHTDNTLYYLVSAGVALVSTALSDSGSDTVSSSWGNVALFVGQTAIILEEGGL